MQSGFLGMAGNADLRSVVAAADKGDSQAKLAIEASSISVVMVKAGLQTALLNVNLYCSQRHQGPKCVPVRRFSSTGSESTLAPT